jgi:hypothetical protein
MVAEEGDLLCYHWHNMLYRQKDADHLTISALMMNCEANTRF